jgi:hypothetical protein
VMIRMDRAFQLNKQALIYNVVTQKMMKTCKEFY